MQVVIEGYVNGGNCWILCRNICISQQGSDPCGGERLERNAVVIVGNEKADQAVELPG